MKKLRTLAADIGNQVSAVLFSCIFDSFSMPYRLSYENINKAIGNKPAFNNIVGAGTQDKLLCKQTSR